MSSPHSSNNLGISIASKVGLQASDVLGSHFDSVENVQLWYNNYARMIGFGVRKDDMQRGKKSGRITIQRWVCHFEGVRDERQSQNCSRVRELRPITRNGCRASFRVNYDESVGKYIAKEFRPEHNHHLASNNEVYLIRSHRKVTDAELAQAQALRHVGVKTCQFMDYMADQCFGDVLAFDAMYKTNAYHKPLVTLVGTNHHFRTTVFDFPLLADETIDSYSWLLQTFLFIMGNRKPVSVITDGNKAMLKAIKTVFTGCIHRLFCWHLERNAQANLKNEDFTRKFRDLMLTPMTGAEFETQWSAVVAEFALELYVRDEILREGAVIEVKTVKAVNAALYTVIEFGTTTTCWNVIHNLQENHIQCSCQMMESIGLPCRHMFHILKVEQIEKIRDNMVLRRWTKKAKEHKTYRTTKLEVDTDVSEVARFSALSAACNKMCYNAAKNIEAYENALVEINRLTLTYEQQSERDGLPNKKLRMGTKLCNLAVVKTKGAMSKAKCVAESSKKYGTCRQVGHTVRTCTIQGNYSTQLSVDGNCFVAFDSSST
ncbi:protein FAR1-RELATED SEQUENCE [Citrus sinensis]|nr:protein FAR1-RELATED SEQUENCE [Citrus sinensis]